MTPFRYNVGFAENPRATFFQEEFRLIMSEAQNGLSFDPERDGVFALRATAVLSFLWGIYTCFSYIFCGK